MHAPSPAARGPVDDAASRRWLALVFIALAQLMVALDATIVSIALPSVQRALGFADAARPWMVSAYTLPFAGLLLVGGRLADTIGRRRALLIGLIGFAAASALGGAAPSLAVLVAARALQGAFAALLSPTALSLVAITFTEPRARARAFAIYGGLAGSGAAVGLVLGGVLTQSASWRWCLYVNVAIAAVAALGARATLPPLAPARPRGPGRPAAATPMGTPVATPMATIDWPGIALVSTGLVAVVLACGRAAALGWASLPVLLLLGAGVAALVAFVAVEARSPAPLLPLHVVADRNRGGACLVAALAVVAMFGLFLLLTYYFQAVLHYSPLHAGLAFLPMTAMSLLGSALLASRLLPRVPPRALMTPALLLAAIGLAWLARLPPHSHYLVDILPAELAIGLGLGSAMIGAFSVATSGVMPHEAGVASAAINTAQQAGGAIGAALLNSVALGHGYAAATQCAAALFVLAALLASLLIVLPAPRPAPPPR